MPLALVLCFKGNMGIAGLWLGFTIACIVLDIGFAMIIGCPDWQEISRKVRQINTKQDPEITMTPEVRHLKRVLTPKSERSKHKDQQQNEGGNLDDNNNNF